MRFEDEMVVCEDTNGKEYVIQKKKIPEEATEGNVIKKGITGNILWTQMKNCLENIVWKK